jgi:hypothetical protein
MMPSESSDIPTNLKIPQAEMKVSPPSYAELEAALFEAHRLLSQINQTKLNDPGSASTDGSGSTLTYQQKQILSPQTQKLSMSDLHEWISHYEKALKDLAHVKQEKTVATEGLSIVSKQVGNLKHNLHLFYQDVSEKFETVFADIKSIETRLSSLSSFSDNALGSGGRRSSSDNEQAKKQGKVFHARESRLT